MFSSGEFSHTYETFPFSDLYQDFLVRRHQYYFHRDSKRKVERTQYFHFIDTYYSIHSVYGTCFKKNINKLP